MATIANSILQAHYRQAEQVGYLRPNLLTESGLHLDAVRMGTGRSDAGAFAKWLSTMWQENDDESGGFLPKPVKAGTFAMSMHAIISAGNLRRALLRSAQFYKLMDIGIQFNLTEQGEEATLSLHITGNDSADLRVFYDAMLVLWLRWASWLIAQPLLLNRVHLPFASPDWSDEYTHMYHCHVFSQQTQCCAVLPSHYLNLPIVKTAQDLPEFLSNAPENLLVHYQQVNSVSAQVLDLFSHQPNAIAADQNAVAEQLAISAATLRRQLSAEGQSFQTLKDQWRRKQAMHLLRMSDRSIHDISTQLGFSEPSAFSRAFKKWTGVNPGDVRQPQNS